jgi:hypothetical protein
MEVVVGPKDCDPFAREDPFLLEALLEAQLGEEERMIRNTARGRRHSTGSTSPSPGLIGIQSSDAV